MADMVFVRRYSFVLSKQTSFVLEMNDHQRESIRVGGGRKHKFKDSDRTQVLVMHVPKHVHMLEHVLSA